MAELSQHFNGTWRISGLKHGQPGITIPAKFTYKNRDEVNIDITSSEQTINTTWETRVGVPIDISDVQRVYTDVTCGGTTYHATDNFSASSVHPVSGYQYSILVSGPGTLASGASGTYTAIYVLKINGEEKYRQDVTGDAAWSIEGPGELSGNVVTNRNSSGEDKTITVIASYGSGVTAATGRMDVTAESSGGGHVWSVQIDRNAFSEDSATTTLRITCDQTCSWTATSDSGWISLATPGGTGSGNQTVTISANTGEDRTGHITVMGTEPDEISYLEITQSTGYQPVTSYTLTVSASTLTVPYEGTLQFTAIYSTLVDGDVVDEADVTNSQDCSWSITSGDSYASVSGGLVTNENDGTDDQSATVRAAYSGETDSKNLTMKGSGVIPEASIVVSPEDGHVTYAAATLTFTVAWANLKENSVISIEHGDFRNAIESYSPSSISVGSHVSSSTTVTAVISENTGTTRERFAEITASGVDMNDDPVSGSGRYTQGKKTNESIVSAGTVTYCVIKEGDGTIGSLTFESLTVEAESGGTMTASSRSMTNVTSTGITSATTSWISNAFTGTTGDNLVAKLHMDIPTGTAVNGVAWLIVGENMYSGTTHASGTTHYMFKFNLGQISSGVENLGDIVARVPLFCGSPYIHFTIDNDSDYTYERNDNSGFTTAFTITSLGVDKTAMTAQVLEGVVTRASLDSNKTSLEIEVPENDSPGTAQSIVAIQGMSIVDPSVMVEARLYIIQAGRP